MLRYATETWSDCVCRPCFIHICRTLLRISNVPSNLLNSVFKILLCTYYPNSSEFRMTCMKCARSIFGGDIYVRSKFSCVCVRLTTCVHAHSLEGTLIVSCFRCLL